MALFGKHYVIEHFINAQKQKNDEKVYRAYVTDAIKLIAELYGSTHHAQINIPRYVDVENPKKEETRTAEEIIENVFKGFKK